MRGFFGLVKFNNKPRHCEVRSNLYIGRAALYSKEIASYLAMTLGKERVTLHRSLHHNIRR